MKWAYYNEIDPFAAQWLRNLIAAGHIPDGEVDERSITEVSPADLRQFRQCHFFAGIGGWAYAARLAGWPDDRELWTGSPPCQPFSVAGKGLAQADERHLWPHYFRLIAARRPAVCMGEQVAAAVGKDWLDGVFADLESIGYASGAAVVPACAVNAPHRRDRLWFVADAHGVYGERRQGGGRGLRPAEAGEGADHHAGGRCAIDGSGAMADAGCVGLLGERPRAAIGAPSSMQGAHGEREWLRADAWATGVPRRGWDGKARRIEPSIRLLADGLSECLARMRSLETAALAEIEAYGQSNKADAGEVLRMVQVAIREKEGWEEQLAGVLQQLYAPTLLLRFLRCVEAARHGAAKQVGFEKASHEDRRWFMRGVRFHKEPCGSSHQLRSDGQLPEQSPNALFALSLILARLASAYWEAAQQADASSDRVGKLKAFGNAVVPQLAAEVISAYMEAAA